MNDGNAIEQMATVEDVAERFGISTRTVHRWMREMDMPYRQPGGPGAAIRFDMDEVEAWSARVGRPAEEGAA